MSARGTGGRREGGIKTISILFKKRGGGERGHGDPLSTRCAVVRDGGGGCWLGAFGRVTIV